MVGNVDTGAGNVNTDAPFEGPFPSSVRRTTRDWFEGSGRPGGLRRQARKSVAIPASQRADHTEESVAMPETKKRRFQLGKGLAKSFGQYISANANLNLEMVHLKFSPLDTRDFGILYYNFRFDEPAQFSNALITSKNAAQEVDFYSVWSATEWLDGHGGVRIRRAGRWAQTGCPGVRHR
jgi:hypothetical protein